MNERLRRQVLRYNHKLNQLYAPSRHKSTVCSLNVFRYLVFHKKAF